MEQVTALQRVLNNMGRRADRGERNRPRVGAFAARLAVLQHVGIMKTTVGGSREPWPNLITLMP